ncbi:hypothetical protein CDD81_478 [Ophiocordyceps australis]|uniref:Enterotoxin n=1 Tax=Ophiocordyceps australis TaxID=1399860 RepID=A0A2C5Y304_9HYPO|nr:hypothetical protein CDD81_478 [Ophiocordyceps australis]
MMGPRWTVLLLSLLLLVWSTNGQTPPPSPSQTGEKVVYIIAARFPSMVQNRGIVVGNRPARSERLGLFEMEYSEPRVPYVVGHTQLLAAIRGWMTSAHFRRHLLTPHVFEFRLTGTNRMLRQTIEGDEIWISVDRNWSPDQLVRWAALPSFANEPHDEFPDRLLYGSPARLVWVDRSWSSDESTRPRAYNSRRCYDNVRSAIHPYLRMGPRSLARRHPLFEQELQELCMPRETAQQTPEACEAALSQQVQPFLAATAQEQQQRAPELENAVSVIVCAHLPDATVSTTPAIVTESQVWDALQHYVHMPFHELYRLFPDLGVALIQAIVQGTCAHLELRGARRGRHVIAPQPFRVKADNRDICDAVIAKVRERLGNQGQQDTQLRAPEEMAAHRPETCTHFDSLTVRVDLGGGFIYGFEGSGTNDDIIIDIGNSSTILARSPAKGTSWPESIDIQRAFGAKAVAVRAIDSFLLYSVQDMTRNGDPWWLKGHATCVGSSRVAEVDKYASLDMEINRQRWPSEYHDTIVPKDWHWAVQDEAAQSLAVQPPGRPDACTHFSSLRITPEFSSSFWSGTYDRVYLELGSQALHAKRRVRLATGPERGSHQPIHVNLEKVFASDRVAVADVLPAIRIFARPGPGRDASSTNAFKINKIDFEATCTGSNSTARVSYSEGLQGNWLERNSGQDWTEVFTGKGLGLEDWRWVQ